MTSTRPNPVIELQLGGVWTNISTFVALGGSDSISITRGRQNEATSVQPSSCTLKVNNKDGRFTPRNPTGPYYGLIGRNTPLRVTVNGSVRFVGEVAAWPQQGEDTGTDAWCEIQAAGVLRRLGQGQAAQETGLKNYTLVTSYANRIWPCDTPTEARSGTRLVLNNCGGNVHFGQGTMGTGQPSGMLIDTTNTVAGDFTPISGFIDAQVTAGSGGTFHAVGFVFNAGNLGTLDLFIRNYTYWPGGHQLHFDPATGNISIISATFDPDSGWTKTTLMTAGAGGAFTDGQTHSVLLIMTPGSGVLNVNLYLDGVALGFTTDPVLNTLGGIPEVMLTYAVGTNNTAVAVSYLTVWADSSLLLTVKPDPVVWAQVADGYIGETAARRIQRLCAENGIPISVFGTGGNGLILPDTVSAYALAGSSNTNYDIPGDLDLRAEFIANDVAAGALIDAQNNYELVIAGSHVTLRWYDSSLAFHFVDSANGVWAPGQHLAVRATLDVNNGAGGNTVTFYTAPTIAGPWTQIGSPTTTAGTTSVHASLGALYVGWSFLFPTDTFNGAVLAAEVRNGINGTVVANPNFGAQVAGTTSFTDASGQVWDIASGASIGSLDVNDTVRMGPQGTGDLISLLQDAADTDMGILYEPPGNLGLAYRTRTSLYNQAQQVTFDYAAGQLGSAPQITDDDQQIHNDVTVSRSGGASARAVLDDGPLSVNPPPDGISTYATSITANVETDGPLPDQASWRLAISSVDEARIPSLTVSLMNPGVSGLLTAILGTDIGDVWQITNLPTWLSYDPISHVVQGYSETVSMTDWTLAANLSPASPYTVAVWADPATPTAADARFDSEFAQLAVNITTTDTSFLVSTLLHHGQLWTTSAGDFPFDINIGGERITVTNITGSSSPQTFTVTRSINGVVKAHNPADAVRLWNVAHYAL